MLRLTAETEYGYHALLKLAAAHGVGRTVTLSEIVGDSGLSEKFMLQALTQLRRAGLVESKRGKNGGYALARRPDRISMHDLLRATRALESQGTLPNTGPGKFLRRWWNGLLRNVEASARKTTIDDALTSEQPRTELMYHI